MSAPLVVNTVDGAVWTRRDGSRDGEALYAPEKCGTCPQFVMVTLTELAELGIVGSADVLPMPACPAPEPLSVERLKEIEARASWATEGPWCTDAWEIYQGTEYVPGISFWIGETCRGTSELGQDRADAAFVAAARSDVPELVAEVRRLRAERAEIGNEIARFGIFGAALPAAKALVKRADELVTENAGLRARIAELEALTPARVQTCRVCGAGYTYGEPCSSCEFRKRMAAELQARGLDGEHYEAVHHSYRVGHDLPETGGTQ